MENKNSTTPQLGRSVSVTAYTAEELKQVNARAYERAYHNWIDSIWETFGSDVVEEDMRNIILSEIAPSLISAPLDWSLAYCQGDGVAFGSFTLTAEQVKELGEELKNGFYYSVKNYNGSHSYAFKVLADTDEEADQTEAEETAERLTIALRELCDKMKQVGYQSSESLTSEEAFTDESNGDLYDIYGRPVLQ